MGDPRADRFAVLAGWVVAFLCACPARNVAPDSGRDPAASDPPPISRAVDGVAGRLDVVIQTGHSEGIWGVHLLPEGMGFVDASADGSLHVRKLDGRLVRVIPAGQGVCCSAISADGMQVLTGIGDGVRIWRIRDGHLEREVASQGHRSVASVAISPDGIRVGAGYGDGTVALWHDGTLEATLGEPGGLFSTAGAVAFSPDGKLLAAGTDQGILRLWDVAGRPLRSWHVTLGSVSALAFRPDGLAIAAASAHSGDPERRGDGNVRIFDLEGHLLKRLDAYPSYSLRYASESGELVLGAAYDNRILVWDRSGKRIRTIEIRGPPRTSPSAIDVSPGGTQIVAASMDIPSLRLFGPEPTPRLSLFRPLAVHRDHTLLAAGKENGEIDLWSTTGKLVSTLDGGPGWVAASAGSRGMG